ncbi:hypothetical protein BGX31_008219 [Mortierella sp. GBA43]|nr:hypothetical protein BGX31_008219 [Mortierella sp. GBA43]
MTQADNFISFHDLSSDSRFLWVSPSAYDVLGYEPEELIGRPGRDVIFPGDHTDSKQFRNELKEENALNDLINSQIIIRFRTKDGRILTGVGTISFCYDFIEFETMERHHQAFAENAWNQQSMEPEARVCLIINRYTHNLTIMYASSACEKVFHVDPDDITGKPVLLYIRSDDLAPFVEQVNLIKSTTAISQMRFRFQSPNLSYAIPCEAIMFGATDGIVAVVRRCAPFVRKHLIGSREQFEGTSRGSSVSSGWSRSYGSSLASGLQSLHSPHSCDGHGSRSQSPWGNVSRDTLNQIRIYDLDNEPMTEEPADQHGYTEETHVPGLKKVIVQHYEECNASDHNDVDMVVRGMAISKLHDGGVDS